MNHAARAESGCHTLEVRVVRQEGDTLILQYAFHNKGQQNTYLFNRVFKGLDDQGKYRTHGDFVYVELDSVQVVISKKVMPVPPDVEVEKPVVPCVSLVRPGEKCEEQFAVSLPLKAWTPYRRSEGDETEESVTALPLWFEVGYFSTSKEGDALAKTVETTEGPALCFYPFWPSSQSILRAGPVMDAVPVVVRRPLPRTGGKNPGH